MPNRIIKESVCSSDTIDQMSWFEECFFHRLWTACDDYGRMDARPAILKSKLFPLKERLSLKDIQNALQKMVDIGCVRLYECDSKPYLYLPSWEVHQQVRAKRGKYPSPEDACNHMISHDIKCARNPIQSESESESEIEANASCAEPETASTPPVILLPLNDGTDYPVSEEQCQEWAGLYPAVDVIQQLRNMKGWLIGNPDRKKTRRGIVRYITGWLAREQNHGGSRKEGGSGAKSQPGDTAWMKKYIQQRGGEDHG